MEYARKRRSGGWEEGFVTSSSRLLKSAQTRVMAGEKRGHDGD